jgi:hypothetical protein
MNVRDQVARIIDRHEWSRLDGGSNGQQIAADLAAKGLLRIEERPEALHRLKSGDIIVICLGDVVPGIENPRLYQITDPRQWDGHVYLIGFPVGSDETKAYEFLSGPANMIVRKVVD